MPPLSWRGQLEIRLVTVLDKILSDQLTGKISVVYMVCRGYSYHARNLAAGLSGGFFWCSEDEQQATWRVLKALSI